jgi:5' nucleotidase, deoxy (Pyrimidine), cytosolic type C protein (NT5C)
VKKIQIALDSDGLLSNFTLGALKIVEEVIGRRYEESDVREFDFVKALDLSVDEGILIKKVIGSRRGFCASLMPYPAARQGVRRLRELGDVFCVTSPWDSNIWWRDEREAWLALHFGIEIVHHAEDKTAYQADVFVDDRSKHVRAWHAAHPGKTAVLWRTPHNFSEAVPAGAHSIASWDALYLIARETALGAPQQTFAAIEGG